MRIPRSYREEPDEEDKPRSTPEPSYPSQSSNSNRSSTHEDDSTQTSVTNGDSGSNSSYRKPIGPRQLTQEETIELTRRAVENGLLETKRSLAGSEPVSDVVRPKLTIDLGHSNIVRIPEAVVDIIKDEVERYDILSNVFLGTRCTHYQGKADVNDNQAFSLQQPNISHSLPLC
jgi:hypothetical protein